MADGVQHGQVPTCMYHALVYATYIFNILSVRGLLDKQDLPSKPHQLFLGHTPTISQFRVFGCPTVICHWIAAEKSGGKQTERGMRGIFIGFTKNQKGYMIYIPASQKFLTPMTLSLMKTSLQQ
jgi:hypothetical protein